MMKKIEAVIKEERLDIAKNPLEEKGFLWLV
jgi:nitrogen regulatory protein PII